MAGISEFATLSILQVQQLRATRRALKNAVVHGGPLLSLREL